MTREEAMETLMIVDENASCDNCLYYAQMEDCPDDEDCVIRQALYMAIEALKQEPNEDCISREQALDPYKILEVTDTLSVYTIRQNLAELPSVTPTRPTGHWIAQDIHNCHTNFRCSECDYVHDFMHLYGEPTADYTFCPNCGAEMKEGDA